MWKNKNLRRLSLSNCEFDFEASARVLEALENNSYLKAVNLSNNGFNEKLAESIAQLLSSETSRLKYINLSNNYLTDEVLKNISITHHLKSLVLRHNSFNNEGALKMLHLIVHNDKLTRVDIRKNLISI
jgi:Ran GTPase-activating protein (RanGAP) involved in mRNA processing and transport